jgi:SAM-dependent methyltransferase
MTDLKTARRLNRAYWDSLAAVHGSDAYYDDDALVRGQDTLSDLESAGVREAVGAVAGLDVLHVQCHIGHDTISLARRGARATGVDFSPASLERARELARRADVAVEFVEADSTALPVELHNHFDLAYATIGVVCRIGDIEPWMRSVAAVLRPGGRLLLVDIHPLLGMLATIDPLVADMPYANDGGHAFDVDGSYADRNARLSATQSVQYAHSLGELVTAVVQAGLRLERLEEHTEIDFDPRGDGELTREDDGRYRARLGAEALPVAYTLIARRP